MSEAPDSVGKFDLMPATAVAITIYKGNGHECHCMRYQRNGKTGNLEMLAIDMTGKTDTMQVTDKHRQGTGTGRASCWVYSHCQNSETLQVVNFNLCTSP